MTAIELKAELQKMINEQEDISILQAIRTLLQKSSLNPVLKSKLSHRAQKAEDDIFKGKVYSKEEIRRRTNGIGR